MFPVVATAEGWQQRSLDPNTLAEILTPNRGYLQLLHGPIKTDITALGNAALFGGRSMLLTSAAVAVN